MRIVHYDRNALVGESGATAATLGWCRSLVALGVKVLLVVDERTAQVDPPPGVQCLRIRHHLKRKVRIPRAIDSWIQDADVLVLHAGWRPSNIRISQRARKRGVPYVASTHGIYLPEVLSRYRLIKSTWARLFERRYLQNAVGIHTYFDDEDAGLSKMGVTSPVMTVPCGFDPPEDFHWNGSGDHLLWLGRFDPHQKGLDLLVRAIAEIEPARRPRLLLRGPDRRGGKDQIRRMVHDLGLDPWVDIGNPVYGAEKWRLVASARGFVYPSRYEAFGMAPAEAVSIGTPTVVTPYPLGRWLAARGAVFLADPEPVSLASTIEKLSSSEAGTIATRGRDVVRSELSWSAAGSMWLKQLEKLLAGSAT